MGIVTTIVMAVAAIAAAGISAYSVYSQGQQQKAANKYNEAVARNNATQAEAWAKYNADRERRLRLSARETMVSSYAKSGVVLDQDGSPGYVLSEQLVQDELAIQTILRGGQSSAGSLRSQADMYSIEGRNAAKAGTLGAISYVAKGVSSVAGMAGGAGGGTPSSTTAGAGSTGVGSGISSSEFSLGASPYAPGRT